MSERQSIAEQLRHARQQQEMTLEQVQQKTGLTANLLEDLESNRFDLVEPVYIRMALRTYAEHFGLDADALITQYNQERGLLVKPVKSKISLPPAAVRQADPFIAWRGMGLVVALVIAALLLLFFFFGRELVENYRQTGQWQLPVFGRPTLQPSPASLGDLQEVASTAANVAEGQAVEGEGEVMFGASPVSPFEAAGGRLPAVPIDESASEPGLLSDDSLLILEVEAVDSTWVEIRGDSQLLFQGVLPQGVRQRWETREAFVLWSGRSQGLRYWFQGEMLDMGQLAGAGPVVRFTASREGIVLLDAEFRPQSSSGRNRQP